MGESVSEDHGNLIGMGQKVVVAEDSAKSGVWFHYVVRIYSSCGRSSEIRDMIATCQSDHVGLLLRGGRIDSSAQH